MSLAQCLLQKWRVSNSIAKKSGVARPDNDQQHLRFCYRQGPKDLPELRQIDFANNRRLLEPERTSHDCIPAADTVLAINSPVIDGRQRALGLQFADPRTQPLWHALIQLDAAINQAKLTHES